MNREQIEVIMTALNNHVDDLYDLLNRYEARNDVATPLVRHMYDQAISARNAFESENKAWCIECGATCPSACDCSVGHNLSQVWN